MIFSKKVTSSAIGFNRNGGLTRLLPRGAAIKRSLLTSTLLLLFAIGVRAQGTFVYTNDDAFAFGNTVSGFAVGANGALTQVAGSPFSTGGTGLGSGFFAANRVTISTAGKFLYAANSGSSTISGFSINPATGFLTAVPGSPFPAGLAQFGHSLAVTPDHRFLYCGNSTSGTISGFTIAPNGTLTPLGVSPFVGGTIDGIRISPNGKFLSAALPFGGSGSLAMFSIMSNGSLSAVPGSPFPADIVSGASVTGIDINCGSNLLFAADATFGPTSVDVFNIAPSGVLSAIPGSPFIFGGSNSNVPFLSPDGRFLFVSNQDGPGINNFSGPGTITVLNVAANGSLTQVAGSPFANSGGQNPSGIGTDAAGKFLFATNFNNTISAFAVASNGVLSPAPGSPFATAQPFGGLLSLTVFPGKTCLSAFDTCLKDNITGDVFAFNSATGAYQYTRCRDNFSISGVGTLRNASGVLTLTDSKPDRRVSGGFLMGQQTGKVTIMFMVAQGVWQTFSVNDTTSFGRGCNCGP
jgi:6-phosphogluconolactonase